MDRFHVKYINTIIRVYITISNIFDNKSVKKVFYTKIL